MAMSIDDFLSTTRLGSVNKALTNMMYGIKTTRNVPPVPSSMDAYGYVFFTRPQLNLQSKNIFRIRHLYHLLDKNPVSLNRYVRVMLDPRLPYDLYIGNKKATMYNDEKISCPFVDNHNGFIPILTNSIKTMSGWPDEVVQTYTTRPGLRKEQFSMVDGIYEINESRDIDATFENHINDPIFMLIQTWYRYASLVFENMIEPYWDMVLNNVIDYNTRIYRLVMDPTWKKVKRIAAVGAAFPLNTPNGKFFDFADNSPYLEQTKDINIRFRCMGFMYDDPILVKEFNEVNAIFNPAYRRYVKGDRDFMVEVPYELKDYFNFRCYPYIDPDTMELKWLVNKSSTTFQRLMNQLEKVSDENKTTTITKTKDINTGTTVNELDAWTTDY